CSRASRLGTCLMLPHRCGPPGRARTGRARTGRASGFAPPVRAARHTRRTMRSSTLRLPRWASSAAAWCLALALLASASAQSGLAVRTQVRVWLGTEPAVVVGAEGAHRGSVDGVPRFATAYGLTWPGSAQDGR